jgi:hypothetical protein
VLERSEEGGDDSLGGRGGAVQGEGRVERLRGSCGSSHVALKGARTVMSTFVPPLA